MGIKVGICGTGAFGACFIPLFKGHPAVDSVILSDLDPVKLAEEAHKFGISQTCPSLEELCQSDIDAIVLFTQNTLHGPQAVQALRSGKHVYSAVPSAITLDEMTALVRAVEETGQIYMIGETSYYYPSAIYCRERFRKGDFGKIVYSEAEYYHDMDHLYDVYKTRFKDDWKKFAGAPPMFYPTHSTSFIVSVTGAYVTHVAGMGYIDRHEDGLFREGVNVWDNIFSNETALCRMSDGSVCRINEFRRISAYGERMRLYGTQASFEESTSDRFQWVDKNHHVTDLSELLACEDASSDDLHASFAAMKHDAVHQGASAVHDISVLPPGFAELTSGHKGSHPWLVHEFVTSCVNRTQPANSVWQAARYLVPGLIAHESARRNSEFLEVPDFGSGPV